MGTRYLNNRIFVGISLEQDKYNKFKEATGKRKTSEILRGFIEDFIQQDEIDSRKDLDERFKLYNRMARRYDQQMIKLFIKSLDNIRDLSTVITNSRLLTELARERKKELFSYVDKEDNDETKLWSLCKQDMLNTFTGMMIANDDDDDINKICQEGAERWKNLTFT